MSQSSNSLIKYQDVGKISFSYNDNYNNGQNEK